MRLSIATVPFALLVAAIVVAPVAVRAVTIDTVTVKNPENAADWNGVGSVRLHYAIGTYEVTNSQYVDFLNAVAVDDTNSLYNSLMATDDAGGIERTGTAGNYQYNLRDSPGSPWGNKPVNFVSFYDAARFSNWLHNGQPGLILPVTQNSNSTEDGAYSLGGANPIDVARNDGAQWFIPDIDEWYKAAFHNPNVTIRRIPGGIFVSNPYVDYATQGFALDGLGNPIIPPTAPADPSGNIVAPTLHTINYNFGADWNGADGNVTTVGSAELVNATVILNDSFYGTFDQSGNVAEWTETRIPNTSIRIIYGGDFGSNTAVQVSGNGSLVNNKDGATEDAIRGFRVAAFVPEPSSFALAALALLAFLVIARGRNHRC